MSTDLHCTPRRAGRLLAAAALAGAAACATPTTPRLELLCSGSTARVQLQLVVDSVTAQAGPALRSIATNGYPVTLTLFPGSSLAFCSDQGGPATFDAHFPDAVASATAENRQARWAVEGTTVTADLNPGARDNNLVISLPLGGGDGSWSINGFAGARIRGRAIRTDTPR